MAGWRAGVVRPAIVAAAGISLLGIIALPTLAGASSSHITWTISQTYPGQGVGYFYGLSCPTATDCVALGAYAGGHDVILTSMDGGSSWHQNAAPAQTLTAISCPTTSECVAAGDTAIEVSQNGGSTWTSEAEPDYVDLQAISCANASDCVAVGNGGIGTDDGILATTDSGAQWFAEPLPAPALNGVSGVSCSSRVDCVAVGESSSGDEAAAFTTDGGQLWTISNIVATSIGNVLTSVACYTTNDCVAVGHGGSSTTILRSTDGGQAFDADNSPTGAGPLDTVSCVVAPVAVDCVAVGAADSGTTGTVLESSDGSNWSNVAVSGSTPALTAVDCATTSDCAAGGGMPTGWPQR